MCMQDEIFTLGSGTGTHPANVGKTLHLQKQFQSCELKVNAKGRHKHIAWSRGVIVKDEIHRAQY